MAQVVRGGSARAAPRPTRSARGRGSWPRLGLALAALAACDGTPPAAREPRSGEEAHAALVAHSAEFERRVYDVTDRVRVAVGFGLANAILLKGDDGVVIVDTLTSVESAREARAALQAGAPGPIRALVYTHNHADHVFGARGFVPEGEVPVYAHETTNAYIDRVVNIIRPIIAMRSTRMFGTLLPPGPDGLVNDGIGPFLEVGPEYTQSLIRPNRTFRDRLEVEIAGIRMQLVHAPGETNDQLFVWLPEERVLLPGDNVYKAFPNLYTIRGTSYRDPMDWVRSLDAMRDLEPAHLVPSHGRPLSGTDAIRDVLTAYRDAIQFVHDQTVRGMNLGLTPDELVERVRLPPHLREHPWLQELYGSVEWSVRSVFSGYLGWFDGDTATLSPAGPDERAAGFVALAGGREALLAAAREAVDAQRFAWGAELATQLLRADPDSAEARRVKARVLRELGRRSQSPNGRNYYLTQALELEGAVEVRNDLPTEGAQALIARLPIAQFMAALPVNLDPDKAADVELVVGFRFPDVEEAYGVHVRRGVAELRSRAPERPDASITTDTEVWKDIITGRRNAALAFASDDVAIDGSTLDLVRFLALFR